MNFIALRPRSEAHLHPLEGDGDEDARVDEPLGVGMSGEDEATAIHAPEEEVKTAKAVKSPPMPTQQEVDEHRVSHLPYRSWCPECVEAFGRERGHRQQEEHRTIPLVSCDYLYLTKNGVFARNELSEDQQEASTRVLVMYCGATQTPFANAVPHKGAGGCRWIRRRRCPPECAVARPLQSNHQERQRTSAAPSGEPGRGRAQDVRS